MPKSTESVIFLLSNNRPLFEGLSSLLKSQNSDFTARLIPANGIAEGPADDLSACDTILCDMGEEGVLATNVFPVLDRIPSFAPVIGLEPGELPVPASSEHPSYLRLAGITSLHKGWSAAWEKIVELRRAWKSPYMHSRIEDVSPSDVLQMIGVSQWTAIVRVEGNQPGLDAGTIKGCISFCKGMPECAWSTNHTGMEAIWELVSLKHGVLDVVRRIWPGCVRNVHGTIEEILITYALGVDESHPAVRSVRDDPDKPVLPPPIAWAEQCPRRTLDSFWVKNRAEVATQLQNQKKQQHPLRWMKWRELERLAVSELQAQFLVFFGDAHNLCERLGFFTAALEAKKISGEAIPVVRTGKIGHHVLYLIGIRDFDPSMRVLSRFPFVVWGDGDLFRDRLTVAIKTGVRALILISSDPPGCLAVSSETAAGKAWNGCCINDAPANDPSAVSGLFTAVAEALSLMAVEKTA